jgi:hypothetical protein
MRLARFNVHRSTYQIRSAKSGSLFRYRPTGSCKIICFVRRNNASIRFRASEMRPDSARVSDAPESCLRSDPDVSRLATLASPLRGENHASLFNGAVEPRPDSARVSDAPESCLRSGPDVSRLATLCSAAPSRKKSLNRAGKPVFHVGKAVLPSKNGISPGNNGVARSKSGVARGNNGV